MNAVTNTTAFGELTAILIRCHFVDQKLLEFANKISNKTTYKIIFIIDAQSGLTGVKNFNSVIVSGKYYNSVFLFCPPSVLWRCGDYAYYAARLTFPNFKYYWMVEWDVFIARDDPSSFFAELDQAIENDFLVTHLRVAESDWDWTKYLFGFYKDIYRCFFPVSRMSARAIDHLYLKRRQFYDLNSDIYDIFPDKWPNDEVFCATVLKADGFDCADLSAFGSFYTPETFNFLTLRHPSECDPAISVLYHPVCRGLEYVQRATRARINVDKLNSVLVLDAASPDEMLSILKCVCDMYFYTVGDKPERVFDASSIVYRFIQEMPEDIIFPLLTNLFSRLRMPDCLDVLRRIAQQQSQNILDSLLDVALGKPAWQSSISPWSNFQHHMRDAEGANSGDSAAPYGFHTDLEDNPWWTVDLKHLYAVSRVRIVNRTDKHDTCERLRGFVLKSSLDGLNWEACYISDASEILDPVPEILFTPRLLCRFLRVVIPRRECLHLVSFHAFGERVGLAT